MGTFDRNAANRLDRTAATGEDRTGSRRDDRVLASTRWVALVVAGVLAAAGVILYVFPNDTASLWAWEMNPRLTTLAVGGGYLAGATFFVRAWRRRRWHAIGLTFVAATVLSTLLLVATVLHWANFNHGHVSFWAWVVVYAVAPVLLPVLWLRNHRRDPGGDVDSSVVPTWIRTLVGVVGAVQVGAALAFFVVPTLAMDWWPWALSPLTTRTLSAFLAFVGLVWMAFLLEDRWSALRMHVESATLGLVLVAVGILRALGDLSGGALQVTGVIGLLAATTFGAVVLQVHMHRQV